MINLFNLILNIYWQISHILAGGLASLYPYTKRDDQCKVENYSGITLLSAFCKLLTSIVNNRLYIVHDRKRIRTRRLQKNVWHSWLHLYFNNDYWQVMENLSHRKRNLLFSCFVDLGKLSTVYPARSYSINWEKQVFLHVLISMYLNDISAVKIIDNKWTQSFPCHSGVNQGTCYHPLSLTFNIELIYLTYWSLQRV